MKQISLAGLITCVHPGTTPVTGSVNRALPLTEIRITDPQGNQVPLGQNGEIRVRGPQLCLGYLDETATRETFDDEGFLL